MSVKEKSTEQCHQYIVGEGHTAHSRKQSLHTCIPRRLTEQHYQGRITQGNTHTTHIIELCSQEHGELHGPLVLKIQIDSQSRQKIPGHQSNKGHFQVKTRRAPGRKNLPFKQGHTQQQHGHHPPERLHKKVSGLHKNGLRNPELHLFQPAAPVNIQLVLKNLCTGFPTLHSRLNGLFGPVGHRPDKEQIK